MSFLAQASNSRPLQLAATAVVSGAVAASLLLGFQSMHHASRLRRLKADVEEQVHAYESAERETEKEAETKTETKTETETDPEELRALALARRAQAGDYAEEVVLEQLTRNEAFLTADGLAKVRGASVVVVGCGGVGSHCCAALARSGVARIRLVDFDQVSLSSLNRHAVATLADVGRPKVQVLARRLLAVTPWVRFDLRRQKFDADSAPALLGPWRDTDVDASSTETDATPVSFIVDAIDNIDTKVELLRYCHAHSLPVIASMGAGTKSDPTRVVVGDIGTTSDDRLSRATRRRLKLLGITGGIPAVYSTETTAQAGDGRAALLPLSDEQVRQGKAAVRELGALPDFRVRILPVLGTMPAVFGYTLANHVLLTLSGYPYAYTAAKGRDKMYDQVLASVHGLEEKLVRHFEVEGGEKKAKKGSLAYGLKVPLTAGDIAFLVEEVFHGRSVVSGLPTRTTLVRWQLPAPPAGQPFTVDCLVDRVTPAAADLAGDAPLQPEQRCARLRLRDLVCMTREEASRHQDLVLLKGNDPASVYDAETLARIAQRRAETAHYEQFRC